MAENPLTKLPALGQLGVAVVVAILIGAGFYYGLWTDMVAQEEKLTKQLTDLKKEIANLQAAERDMPGLEKKVADFEKQLETLKRFLPADKETADLIRKVQYLASASNLTIKKFNPATATNKEDYQEWPIMVDVEGTYHNLAGFFDKIGRLPRLVNVGNLQVRAQATPGAANTIAASCTATTFVYLETPVTAGKPGAAGARK